MGCGECKLLRLLKFQDFIEELIGVDVDASILQSHRYRIQPLTADYLFRRPNPLCVQLMRGLCDYLLINILWLGDIDSFAIIA